MHKTITVEKYPTFKRVNKCNTDVNSYNMRHSNLKIPYRRSDMCKQSLLY